MKRIVELALLESLEDAGGYAMPKKSLYADLNLRLPKHQVMTQADFDSLLHKAQEKERVRALTSEDGVTITLTDQGRHRLSELRS